MATRALLRFKRPDGLDGQELAHAIAEALALFWPRRDPDDDSIVSNADPVWVTDYGDDEIEVAVKVPGQDSPSERAELDRADEAIVAAVVAGREPKTVPPKKRKFAARL